MPWIYIPDQIKYTDGNQQLTNTSRLCFGVSQLADTRPITELLLVTSVYASVSARSKQRSTHTQTLQTLAHVKVTNLVLDLKF